jgi:biuret amidohydrolase
LQIIDKFTVIAAAWQCLICHSLHHSEAQSHREQARSIVSSMNPESWKRAFRSLYYKNALEPDDPQLVRGKLALLVIDIQNAYLTRPDPTALDAAGRVAYDDWTAFHARMHETVLPTTASLLARFRQDGHEVLYARIACQSQDGRDRSLSQKMPGWNNLLLPKNSLQSQIVSDIAPQGDEIVVTKTTDSALTGTNLRLMLTNLGITQVVCCGIFTDQCVSSTVRSLADESFSVIVVEDACAAASHELHVSELTIINMIYCHVMSSAELLGYLPPTVSGLQT